MVEMGRPANYYFTELDRQQLQLWATLAHPGYLSLARCAAAGVPAWGVAVGKGGVAVGRWVFCVVNTETVDKQTTSGAAFSPSLGSLPACLSFFPTSSILPCHPTHIRRCQATLQLPAPPAADAVYEWVSQLSTERRVGLPMLELSAAACKGVVVVDSHRRCIVRDMVFR